MKSSSWIAKGMLLVVSTLLGLAAVEVALRVIAPGNVFHSDFPLYPHRHRVMQLEREGVQETIVISTNRWGLRGDEPPADWRNAHSLVTVGGSTTQCFYLDDSKTWPAQVQRELRKKDPAAWVGNAGLDGHTSRGHIQLMKQVVIPIKPRTVVFLVGVNDLALSLRDTPRTYDLRGDWKWQFFNRSRIGQILYTWALIALKKVPPTEQVSGPYQLHPLTAPMKLPTDLKSMLPGLREYRDNIRTLIQLSREAGIRPVFLTQPLLSDDSPHWRTLEGSFSWVAHVKEHLSAADYWRLMKTYNDELMATCREERVACLDLAAVVPHDPTYFLDIAHFNNRGAEKVGNAVAAFLETHPS